MDNNNKKAMKAAKCDALRWGIAVNSGNYEFSFLSLNDGQQQQKSYENS